ncbi:apolipoprotein N-acyltransferase [Streptomyces glaucescens]
MTGRRIAGWAVLSLIPLVFVTLAVLAGQLAEMAVGVGIAVFCCLALWFGLRLLDSGRRS